MKPPPSFASSTLEGLMTPLLAIVLGVVLAFIIVAVVAVALIKIRARDETKRRGTVVRIRTAVSQENCEEGEQIEALLKIKKKNY